MKNGPSVTLPNNQSLQVIEQGNLNLHKNLPYEASRAYILPNLLNESLFQSVNYAIIIVLFFLTNIFATYFIKIN